MKRRSGSMLLEVILAIGITSIVLTGGVAALRAVTQLGKKSHDVATSDQDVRSAEVEMRALGRMGLRIDSLDFVLGTSDDFTFSSMCITASGWSEPCHVSIRRSAPTSEHQSFKVSTSTATSFGYGIGAGEIRYLTDASNSGRWLSEWRDSVRLPAALQLVAGKDSMFLRMGSGLP